MRKLVLAALLVTALPLDVQAAQAVQTTGPLPAVETLVETVASRTDEAYHETLARYDAALVKDPANADAAVARCEFISYFTDPEGGQYIESAQDDFDACTDDLKRKLPLEPRVQVYLYEQDWDDDAAEGGEALLEASVDWPMELRRRIASRLSRQLEDTDDGRAGELAVLAAELGEPSRLASAIEHLARGGQTARAVSLLEHTPPDTNGWLAASRIRAALKLDNRNAALDDLRRHFSRKVDVPADVAALAYLHAGDVEGAKKALEGDDRKGGSVAAARFDVAMAEHDWQLAAGQIDLTNVDEFGENLERYAKLVITAPTALLHLSMWLATLVVAFLLLTIALSPAALLLPVHYRGMMRRLEGKATVAPFETIGLRHAWLGLAAMMVLPMVSFGILHPEALVEMLSADGTRNGRILVDLALWGAMSGLAACAWVLWRFAMRGGFGWAAAWRTWRRVLLAVLVVLAVGFLHHLLYNALGTDTRTAQTEMVRSMVNSGETKVGMLLGFLTIVVLVPIWEEFVFRGLLLGGMARHISFGWANALQAMLFASLHDDFPRFLYYLTLGLLAGWLVRSARTLVPSILLHVAVNLIAFASIIR